MPFEFVDAAESALELALIAEWVMFGSVAAGTHMWHFVIEVLDG